jgi:hypothetical protein
MKALSIVAIVIACLVGGCSSSQQQGSREQGDEQANMAFPGGQAAPGGAVRDKTLSGTTVKWTRTSEPQG